MPFASRRVLAIAAAAALATVLVPPTASADDPLSALAGPSLRSTIASDRFYFVMTDRYADGDPANNAGGRSGSVSATGYQPTSDAYYHGGDLAGLTGRCDPSEPTDTGLARIKRLGFTAVWITPPFVQRTVQGTSAAYHGYWFLDLSKPDPHLGTEAEFAAFITCAHRLGLKVFVDVVTNHTADVISYPQGNAFVSLSKRPYRTAHGRAFDPWTYTRGTVFPSLSPKVSFAKTPFVDPALASAKWPAVLNETVRYHNRGDIDWSSCVGRCEMDGDFSGLDDLMTEDWTVVKALGDAYGAWISKYGIDGFRIDTAKHVDPYFFGRWLPQIQEAANASGKPEFTSFGEIWNADTAQLSEMMLDRGLPSVLDFPFQEVAKKFVLGQVGGSTLAQHFADDDYYTSATTNAYGLTTFLGNHDMGRIGFFLATGAQASPDQLVERDLLAHDLLFLTRGVPVVYYGDEVGMTGSGDGTDKNARQDMFPTQVASWRTERRIGGGAIGTGSSLTQSTAIGSRISELASVRSTNPALATGAQITRYGSGTVFATSRIDAAARVEYLVAFNTGNDASSVAVPTSTPSTTWTALLGGSSSTSDATGAVRLTLPPRSSLVLKAGSTLPAPTAPKVTVRTSRFAITGTYAVTANVPGTDPSTVTFVMRSAGSKPWRVIGTDDARPFRVYVKPSRGAGARAQVAAIVRDTAGGTAASAPVNATITPFE